MIPEEVAVPRVPAPDQAPAEREAGRVRMVDGTLRVAVLGPLRAWLDDVELDLGTARRRATFAALAGRADERVGHRDLIEAVWGSGAPANARGNLHTYVSGLRRALGPARERLGTVDGGYRLRIDVADVDAHRFERHCGDARRLLLEGALEAAADELGTGLALWQGEAYSAVPGPFAELEGQRLTETRIAAVEQRAGILIETGRAAEVVADAADLVRRAPMRESARELLVLALHRSGRHAEALAAAEEARRSLDEELGVSPGPGLTALHEHLRAGTAGGCPTGTRRAPGPVVPSSVREALSRPGPGLIGRDDAVARLSGVVTDLLDGSGRAVWVEGDAGLGRSALLHATLAGADEWGCALGWAVADELFELFELQVLQSCFDIDLVPGGRLAPGHDDDSPEDRLAELVTRTCARAPLAIVVDDVHWADAATIRFWHRLVAMTRELPLLLVATSWPCSVRPDLDGLRRAIAGSGGEVVDLAPLTAEESVRLVVDNTSCTTWTAQRLADDGKGNPMRLLELAADLDDRRTAPPRGPQAPETGRRPPIRSTAAAAHRMLVALPLPVVEVLRAASVLGVEFRRSDLELVSDAGRDAVRGAVGEALAAQILIEERGVLAFRTDPLWQAAFERIPVPLRGPLRRQFTEALAAAGRGEGGSAEICGPALPAR